jgi:hypothetical protein
MKSSVLAVAILAVLQTVLAHSHGKYRLPRMTENKYLAGNTGFRKHVGKRQDQDLDYEVISEIIVYVDECGSTLSVETRTCTATQSVDVSAPLSLGDVYMLIILGWG